MSNQPVSNLPSGTLSATLMLYGVDNGVSYKIPASLLQPALSIGGTVVAGLDAGSFSQTMGVLHGAPGQLSIGGTVVSAVDASLAITSGSLGVVETSFGSLSAPGSLTSATQLLVVQGGTAYSTTLGALALEIGVLLQPTITINTIPGEVVGQPFTVTGTLLNYTSPPTLTYADNSGAFGALPGGSTVTSSSFTFTHPGLSAGTDTISVRDSNGVTATSNSFVEAPITATGATISGAPSSGVVGTAITGVTDTLTPTGATGYVCLNTGGADEGSRISFTGTSIPSLTPATAATYVIAIYAASTGGTALATSSNITVSSSAATAATISGAPSTGHVGAPISGITDTLTPSGATAYAVLYTGSADEGTRVSFTGTTYPSIAPANTGTYTAKIYAAATGGTALATSTSITVSAAVTPNLAAGTTPSLVLDASVAGNVTSDAAYTTTQSTNGGNVLGWKDATSNAYNFKQTTAGLAPTLVTAAQNGKNGIKFAQANTAVMGGPSALASLIASAINASGGSGFTLAFAFKYSNTTGGVTFLSFVGGSGTVDVAYYGGIYADYNPGSVHGTNSSAPAAATLAKVILTYKPATSTIVISIAGQSDVSFTYTPTTNAMNAISIGQVNNAAAGTPDFTFFEVDMWLSPASGSGGATPSGDIATIMSYLTAKWGS